MKTDKRRGVMQVAPLVLFAVALILTGCAGNVHEVAALSNQMATTLEEAYTGAIEFVATERLTDSTRHSVVSIPMAAPLDRADVELSGLAWHGDRLILLPQFPARLNSQIYALDKSDITAYLRGELDGPLTPAPIAFDDGAISALMPGYDGFEAIAFDGDRAYLTIETHSREGMLGILVGGEMAADGGTLSVNPHVQAFIPVQADLVNMSDESLFVADGEVVTMYEANGRNINPGAVVHRFDQALQSIGVAPMVNLEYRITDATTPDAENRFWAINYLFPGNAEKLRLADDPLLPADYVGGNGDNPRPVERLVELQWSDEGVALTETPPINLQLMTGGIARNWEGVVRFQDDDLDGFLLVTDKFPSTTLAFVQMAANGE